MALCEVYVYNLNKFPQQCFVGGTGVAIIFTNEESEA